jgi:collagen triple helix repeat protein
MLSRLREHFGTAGLVVAIVALVAALAGGAIAANNSGGGKATASAKAKKGPRGPKGAKGDTGPVGPAGPAGPAGAKGADGANGLDGEAGEIGATGPTGKTGTNGANGATGETGAKGATGADGTQGPAGPTGPEGVCSTASCVLPKGVPLRGTWSTNYQAAAAGESVMVSIPFTIPTSSGPGLGQYMKVGENEDKQAVPQCKGGAADPVIDLTSATSGNTIVCIFTLSETNWSPSFVTGSAIQNKAIGATARKSGFVFEAKSAAAGQVSAFGTWIITTKP